DRVAGGGVTQAGEEHDLPGDGLVGAGLLVRVDLEEAGGALLDVAAADGDLLAGLEAPSVDAREDVAAPLEELDLEAEGGEGALRLHPDLLLRLVGSATQGGRALERV